MERVLITGLTGRSGKYLIEELKMSFPPEIELYAIVRPSSKQEKLKNLNIILQKGDLEDEEFLEQAFLHMDTILHIAGILISEKIVRAAIKQKVKRLILVHTTGIYSKYKAAGEEYKKVEQRCIHLARTNDVALTILRPTMIYGNLGDYNMELFIKMVDRFRIFPVINGGGYPLQPVHQCDLGRAYYQILLNPAKTMNQNYILSGATKINLIDILKNISNFLGKKTIFIPIPYQAAYFASILVYYASLRRADYREKVQRMVEPRAYPHTKASQDFNYQPMDFLQGLKSEVEEYLRHKHDMSKKPAQEWEKK